MVEGDKLYALLKHGASIHIISQELSIDYYGVLELNYTILTLFCNPCISTIFILSILRILHILHLFRVFRGQMRVRGSVVKMEYRRHRKT